MLAHVLFCTMFDLNTMEYIMEHTILQSSQALGSTLRGIKKLFNEQFEYIKHWTIFESRARGIWRRVYMLYLSSFGKHFSQIREYNWQ